MESAPRSNYLNVLERRAQMTSMRSIASKLSMAFDLSTLRPSSSCADVSFIDGEMDVRRQSAYV